jgi:hypothetical protein
MKTASKLPPPARDTRVVQAISLEEIEALSPAEREKLLAELKAAEARIEAGEYVVYDREDQRRRFAKIYSERQ